MHHVECAPWYHYDYLSIAEIGKVPKLGGLDVDYDALPPAVVFAIEIAPQLLVDGRSWEARTGQPETVRQTGGDPTHAFGAPGPQSQFIKGEAATRVGKVY